MLLFVMPTFFVIPRSPEATGNPGDAWTPAFAGVTGKKGGSLGVTTGVRLGRDDNKTSSSSICPPIRYRF